MKDGLNSKSSFCLETFGHAILIIINFRRHFDMSSEEQNRLAKPNVNIYKKPAQVEPPVINFSNYTKKIEKTESDHLVAEALRT